MNKKYINASLVFFAGRAGLLNPNDAWVGRSHPCLLTYLLVMVLPNLNSRSGNGRKEGKRKKNRQIGGHADERMDGKKETLLAIKLFMASYSCC